MMFDHLRTRLGPLATLDWPNIALHAGAAIAMVLPPLLFWPFGLVATVAASWLLREAAQANRSDLKAALASLPTWSLQKQLEWLAPVLAATAFIAGWQFWRWS